MNKLRLLIDVLLLSAVLTLGIGCRPATQSMQAFPVIPDERDRQVLEAFLSHLLADPDFNLTRVVTNKASVVLHWRTPEQTGFVSEQQMSSDTRGHNLPEELGRALRQRNTESATRTEAHLAVTAFYSNLTFTAGIVVADLTERMGVRGLMGAFVEAHPDARGWVVAHLPGYSAGGERAIVRAHVGPTSHGATVTALLELRDGRWVVEWYSIAQYV